MRIPYKIKTAFKISKNWLLFIGKDMRRIRFLFQWVFSFRSGGSAHEKGFPWVTFEAKQYIDSFLTENMNVFEWGSGGSTIFLAQRVNFLISLEHNPEWHKIINKLLEEKKLSRCRCILKEPKPGDAYLSSSPKYKGLSFEEYCRAIEAYPDNYFDFILIDGKARLSCVSQASQKIKPNGYLLLDDSDNPEYVGAGELLKGWKKRDFPGPKPCVINFHQTTIWQKHVSLSAK